MLDSIKDTIPRRRVGKRLYRAPLEEREHRHPEAKQIDDDSPAQNLFDERRIVISARAARGHRQVRRDSDDEKEEWKDQIGRSPPVPFRVLKRREDRAP